MNTLPPTLPLTCHYMERHAEREPGKPCIVHPNEINRKIIHLLFSTMFKTLLADILRQPKGDYPPHEINIHWINIMKIKSYKERCDYMLKIIKLIIYNMADEEMIVKEFLIDRFNRIERLCTTSRKMFYYLALFLLSRKNTNVKMKIFFCYFFFKDYADFVATREEGDRPLSSEEEEDLKYSHLDNFLYIYICKYIDCMLFDSLKFSASVYYDEDFHYQIIPLKYEGYFGSYFDYLLNFVYDQENDAEQAKKIIAGISQVFYKPENSIYIDYLIESYIISLESAFKNNKHFKYGHFYDIMSFFNILTKLSIDGSPLLFSRIRDFLFSKEEERIDDGNLPFIINGDLKKYIINAVSHIGGLIKCYYNSISEVEKPEIITYLALVNTNLTENVVFGIKLEMICDYEFEKHSEDMEYILEVIKSRYIYMGSIENLKLLYRLYRTMAA